MASEFSTAMTEFRLLNGNLVEGDFSEVTDAAGARRAVAKALAVQVPQIVHPDSGSVPTSLHAAACEQICV